MTTCKHRGYGWPSDSNPGPPCWKLVLHHSELSRQSYFDLSFRKKAPKFWRVQKSIWVWDFSSKNVWSCYNFMSIRNLTGFWKSSMYMIHQSIKNPNDFYTISVIYWQNVNILKSFQLSPIFVGESSAKNSAKFQKVCYHSLLLCSPLHFPLSLHSPS